LLLGYLLLTTQIYNRSHLVIVAFVIFLALSPLMLTLQSSLADSVISTIKVGDTPTEITFNPINGSMYIVNNGDENGVSVINGKTNRFLMNITGTGGPNSIAFNSDNNNTYVTNSDGNIAAVISAKDNKVIKKISGILSPVGINIPILIPNGIGFNPKNGNMYVPSNVCYYNDNTQCGSARDYCARNVSITCMASVIDPKNNEIIKNIPIGIQGDPRVTSSGLIAIDPNNGNVYVGNYRDKSISVINSTNNQVVATITLTGTPSAIAFNPNNGNMYVVGGPSNIVSVIDTKINKIVKSIPGIGIVPNAIAYNPTDGNMYVLGGFSRSVFAIDSERNNSTTIPLMGSQNAIPNAIAYNPKNGNMYVTVGFDDVVKVIDSHKVVETIPVREGAFKIALNPINNDMYVTNTINNTVSVIG
jgi:YVTN family beta-propeller protein